MKNFSLSPEAATARILVVDDEPTNLKLAEAMLRTAGHQNIVLVQDPRQAMVRYQDQPFDLIVLDLNMPHLDGYGLMAQFKALNDPLLPPILVLTAQGSREHLLRALDAGARDFVSKPFDRTELLMRVHNLIDAQRAHRALFNERALLEARVLERTAQLQQEVDHRRQAQATQALLLKEKEGLLREIHHRVKNNLQVISSLLRLEGGRNAQTLPVSSLQDMQGRIRAMALLHESLYRTGTFATVDLAAYLRQLATQSFRAAAPGGGSVRLELNLAPVLLIMDQAAPCGLLVNELVSNALKHAFPDGRTGEIRIELQVVHGTMDQAGWLSLRVIDNGIGLPDDFEVKRQTSLGLKLSLDLARQMGGTLTIESTPSTSFGVIFQAMETPTLVAEA